MSKDFEGMFKPKFITITQDVSQLKLNRFNPLEAARESSDFLVQFLEQMAQVSLDKDAKQALLAVVDALPSDASMRDLIEALKAKETTDFGLTSQQYEALTPLFLALHAAHSAPADSDLALVIAHGLVDVLSQGKEK